MTDMEKLRARQHIFEQLVKSPGWLALQEICEEQVRARRMQIFQAPVEDLKDIFALSTVRGTVGGIQLAMSLPSIVLDDIRADIQALLEKEREET